MTVRVRWQLVVAGLLLVSLGVLATLQYRWLGDVSEAERERMRASLRTRTSELAQEFDRELTRTYVAFHVDGSRLDEDAGGAVAEAYARWQSAATAATIIRDVYLVEGRTFDEAVVRRFNVDRQTLEPARWPPDIDAAIRQTQHALPRVIGAPAPMLMADAIDSRIPALIVPAPRVRRIEKDGLVNLFTDPAAIPRAVVVVLDSARLQRDLLEPLVTKHFGRSGASDYNVTIARRTEPNAIIFNSGDRPVESAGADVTAGLFDLRMDELNRLASQGRGDHVPIAGSHPRADSGQATAFDSAQAGALPGDRDQRVAITIVRRADGPDATRVFMAGGEDQGAWQVRVRHRSGSLDALVARSRRRNVAISLGVLGLLGASVMLIIAAAQRQQRLARQQMEFVAGVSHELRTPLAVICSAGENLADGVVADDSQVKRYGMLIQTEGRRLHDMVERVMAFAGMASGVPIRLRHDVDITRVVADAVDRVGAEARDRAITVAMRAAAGLPTIDGDADALRSAVQNVLDNAIKYSATSGVVEVDVDASGTHMRIRVADRGIGIDPADVGQIFRPFFRGRRAVDSQVRGSGIGLSVVRQVVDAHHGAVEVESTVGTGTIVTLTLPVVLLHDTPAPFARPERRRTPGSEPRRPPRADREADA